MNRLLITALFLAACLSSCSVKEDRSHCPCRLSVDLLDAARTAPDCGITLWSGGSSLLEESASPRADWERSVPRGPVRTVVTTGAPLSLVREGLLRYRDGGPIDTLWAHTALVDCSGETARDTARLHRQFARARLLFTAPPQEGEVALVVSAGSGALDLRSLTPVPGEWSLPLEPDEAGECLFCVPRLTGSNRFTLAVTDADGHTVTADLQSLLREQGYSWAASDLDDFTLTVDWVRGTVTVTVLPWTGGGSTSEII